MNIDPGLVVVIGAVLIFYLRLIVIQRQRARQAQQQPVTPSRTAPRSKAAMRGGGAASQKQAASSQKKLAHSARTAAFDPERYSILSPRSSDRIIGAVGLVLLLLGMILYAGILPLAALQTYWWLPAAAGIIAFSWAFKL